MRLRCQAAGEKKYVLTRFTPGWGLGFPLCKENTTYEPQFQGLINATVNGPGASISDIPQCLELLKLLLRQGRVAGTL